MSKPKVYITREIPARGLDILKDKFNVEVWPNEAAPPKETILENVSEVKALVSLLSDEIDAEVFEAATDLRIIAINQPEVWGVEDRTPAWGKKVGAHGQLNWPWGLVVPQPSHHLLGGGS